MAKPRPSHRTSKVLLQVMVQDPDVVSAAGSISPVHPVVAIAASGFADGPVTARVAVVDVDAATGRLRPPATLDPGGSPYRDVGAYRVKTPFVKGASRPVWAGGRTAREMVADLAAIGYDDPFLKVSVFGTVLRAIAFVEHPAVLGRRVEWAFDGEQLLVVPRAGIVDNAFYHRASRSLQFYSFTAPEHPDRVVHAALSQDIVSHETTHALIDGIAPDLYGATDPESLAIHEAVADVTAVMLSLRNREIDRRRPSLARMVVEVTRSSRYSKIAEEFGRWRGQGSALRDARNRRSYDPAVRAPSRSVDRASPHSISQVLSGALFAVLVRSFEAAADEQAGHEARNATVDFRTAVFFATHRVGSMVFKGLDWLPPGEVSLADFAESILAADRFHHPDRPAEREWFTEECAARGIALPSTAGAAIAGAGGPQPVDAKGARAFVAAHRALIGLPDRTAVRTSVRVSHATNARLTGRQETTEYVEIERRYAVPADATAVRLVKASWWTRVPIDLGPEFGKRAEVKTGATVAVVADGSIVALLRGATTRAAADGRPLFLRRLVDGGTLVPPAASRRPDDPPTPSLIRSSLADGTLRIDGGFQSLHIADTFD